MLENYFNKFTRCFYTLSKEVFDQSAERNDPKVVARRRRAFHRDIALLLYSSRVLLVFAVVHFGEEGGLGLGPASVATFCRLDPIARVVQSDRRLYEPFIGVLVFLFALFDFTCQRAVYRLGDTTKSVVWRWWHESIVVNVDAYRRAVITDRRRLEAIYARRESQFVAPLYQQSAAVAAANGNERETGKVGFFSAVWKTVTRIKAHLLVLYHFEHVNRAELFGRRLRVFPQLSDQVRARVLRFLLLTEVSSFCCLLLIGKAFVLIKKSTYTLFNVNNFYFYFFSTSFPRPFADRQHLYGAVRQAQP